MTGGLKLFPFLLQGIATASDAYIIINGSPNLQYGGNALSDDATTTDANMDHTNGAVEGYGVPNRLTVVSVSNTAAGAAIGFSLTYRQIPCSGVRSRTIQPQFLDVFCSWINWILQNTNKFY